MGAELRPAPVVPFRWTPPLYALVVLAGWVTLWVAGHAAGAWDAPLAGWLPLPLFGGLAGWVCWRAAARPGLPAPARRFWRSVALSLGLVSAGTVSNAVEVLTGSVAPDRSMGAVTLGLFGLALLATQVGLMQLPGTAGRSGNWREFALDCATVMVAVSLFAWYFAFRPYHAGSTGTVVALAGLVALCFVSVVAAVKITSSGVSTVDRRALRLLILATVVGAGLASLGPLLSFAPYVTEVHLTVPLAGVLVGLAGDRQARAAGTVSPPLRSRHRWSLAPYAAVAAANVLLLVKGREADGNVLVVGAVLLTGLVIVRQVMAFRANARLLDQRDESLGRLRDTQEQLAHQARHDELTGLANRRLLDQRISEVLAVEEPDRVHVALIDLDDFKDINDRLGHGVGDQLLVSVARRLTAALRRDDLVARLGGDEFALLIHGAGTADADQILDRVTAELQRPTRAGEHNLLVQASIGVADAGGAGDQYEVLRRADVAMYTAKDQGRSRWVRYEPGLDQAATENAEMGADLLAGLADGQLRLVYQPIVSLPDGRTTGVETLVRWQHPERGWINPGVFIPVAERNGTIVELGRWILRGACRQLASWDRELGPAAPRRVSVNVSPRQLNEPNFTSSVAGILAETGVDPARIVIEVTETAVFDRGRGLDCLHALRALGVRVALDDFGTGHSSLGLLLTVPVDILKVDKSFVDNITMAGHQHTAIATGLIHISQGLNLVAVAEGVETAEQAEQLERFGYRYAQGYYFARPMPPAELTERLARDFADTLPAVAQ